MADDIYIILGRKVREARKRAELTLDALGEKAGISGAFVAHIEAGRKNASLDTVNKLSQALELSLGELLEDPIKSDWGKNQLYLKNFAHILRSKTPGQKRVILKLVKTACGLLRE